MPRYLYVSFGGERIPLDDWQITEHGIEGLVFQDGKVVAVFVFQDGSVMYDYDSGRTMQDIQKNREAFRKRMQEIEEVDKAMQEQAVFDEDDDEPTGMPYKAPPGPSPSGYA